MAVESQEHFKRTVFIQQNVKLFNAMKLTHPTFFTKMIKIFEGKESLDCVKHYEIDGKTYIEYSPSELFDKIFGPIKLVFADSLIKSGNLVDINPREYLYDSFRSGCHEYKGVVIPNMDKYKFRVDLFSTQKMTKDEFISKMMSSMKK